MSPIVTVGRGDDQAVSIVVDHRIEIGRECQGFLIDDPAVSRRHLSVEPTGAETVLVTDLGSSNGTLHRGMLLDAPLTLVPGDSVSFGSYVLTLTQQVAGPRSEPRDEPPKRATMVGAGLADLEPGAIRPVDTSSEIRGTSIDLVASRIHDDRDSRAQVEQLEAKTGGTLTFAFSDIESSTELAQAMGDQQWFKALTSHNTIIEGLVGDHGGNVIKSVGDGFMITFPGATSAARCAVAIQRAMAAHARNSPELGIRVRMGLHTGEAIESGGDLFGTHVNMAARVANLAAGGEIMVSSLTRAIAQAAGDLAFTGDHEVELKGLEGTHRVSLLIWD